jgi:SAM-dependent methyltransferase
VDGHLRDLMRRGYDALAPDYADWADYVTPPLRERYVAKLLGRLPETGHVLELGCGTGLPVTAALAGRHLVTGVDLSPRMLAVARRNVPSARFVEADMTALELAPASFDGVIASYSLIHVPRDELGGLLVRIRRWLKPTAPLVATLGAEDLPLVAGAGFAIEETDVVTQQEPEGVVRFLWVVCRA